MVPAQDKPMRIIIAGAGIGGLSLAIFLERAQIDYIIVERSPSMRTVGGALGMSAQVFRVFDQIGIYEELAAISTPMLGLKFFNQKKQKVGQLDGDFWETRYGYRNRIFPRNELMEVLLRHVPSHKIQWGKKITSVVQNEEGVSVVCADASHFEGDILIGSDGAYSTVRRSMYKNMQEKGQKLSKRDLENLRFDQFAILGVTADISDEWPILKEPSGAMQCVVAGKDNPYNVFAIPLPGGRVNWLVGGRFDMPLEDQDEFCFSDWESEPVKAVMKEIERLPVMVGGTIGDLLRKTERSKITRTRLEDKLFDVWFDGRTCLMGDAVHKTLPAGGQGANQAILDAVCLANLLHELPSTSMGDISKAFAKYRELRYNGAKTSVNDSGFFNDIVSKQGIVPDILRTVVLSWMPSWVIIKIQDVSLGERPLLTFEKPIADNGAYKNTSRPHTVNNQPHAL